MTQPQRPQTVRVKVPGRFYEDHLARDCGDGGTVVREYARGHKLVELNAAAYDDLLSDADLYSDYQEFGEDYFGLVTSAIATAKALRKVERPPTGGGFQCPKCNERLEIRWSEEGRRVIECDACGWAA